MNVQCPACLGVRIARRFVKNGCDVRACRDCGTWFVVNPPSADALREIYRKAYFTGRLAQHATRSADPRAWRSAVANARRRLARLLRAAPRGHRLLDVGCGTGAFLSIARDVYDCFGVDVSDEAVEVLRQRLGVPARAGDVRSLDLPEASFDVVTMFDVIEHVREPGEVLAAVGRFLAPHGVVMLTTGDVDSLICRLSGRWWHLMTPPEHLSFFSGRGIVRLAERCGLEVRRLSHEPVSANLAYIAHKLADVAGGPTRWLPAAVSVLHLDAVDVDVNLLDVMTVVARRR